MAEFSRKELKKIFEAAEVEVPKDVLGQICELHTSNADALTEEIKDVKAKLSKAEQERDDYKAKVPENAEDTVAKSKFDKLQKDFDDYKNTIEAEKTHTAKLAAYRELFKEAGVSEKRLESVLKVTAVDDVELEDGKIKDAEKRIENIKTEWADFIEEEHEEGSNIGNPLNNKGTETDLGKLSMSEYIAARKKGEN